MAVAIEQVALGILKPPYLTLLQKEDPSRIIDFDVQVKLTEGSLVIHIKKLRTYGLAKAWEPHALFHYAHAPSSNSYIPLNAEAMISRINGNYIALFRQVNNDSDSLWFREGYEIKTVNGMPQWQLCENITAESLGLPEDFNGKNALNSYLEIINNPTLKKGFNIENNPFLLRSS